MIGASGIVTENNYPNTAEAPVSTIRIRWRLGFYTRRLSSSQYIGGTYQYLRSQSDPVNVQANPATAQPEVQTHTLLAFYTIYLNPTLSLSLSSGPQHTDATQAPRLPSARGRPL